MAVTDITNEVRLMREHMEMCQPHHDNVNHPIHYNASPAKCECGRRIECIDVTRHMNFNIGNVVKYLWRASLKGGLEDLKKARWYLDDQIKQLERNNDE
jgi:hypothetical protein